jgi:hypothetical protein
MENGSSRRKISLGSGILNSGKCREMDIHFLEYLNGTANPARSAQAFSIAISITSRKVTKSSTVPRDRNEYLLGTNQELFRTIHNSSKEVELPMANINTLDYSMFRNE